ncbi:flavin reductase [Bailinhaonella thermotolerans]|uniref:Flavin reductase n=2 Tax=Bailinhaonella thermotolerans TaxID=1070861 RepID=A0A3A4ALR0_9ACTN|nr:flavin reductase [Bailinhaonella thermotolerans]
MFAAGGGGRRPRLVAVHDTATGTAAAEPYSPNGAQGADGSVNGDHFRSVLGHFATGVVAITAIDPESGGPCGLAANSFTSVSLDPPLVAFCVAHTSSSWPKVREAARHCINILGEQQLPVCRQLAAKGGDKFRDLAWNPSPSGTPILEGALAWIDCSIEAEYVAGDHVIVVARVHELNTHGNGDGPLVFFRGAYGRFHA